MKRVHRTGYWSLNRFCPFVQVTFSSPCATISPDMNWPIQLDSGSQRCFAPTSRSAELGSRRSPGRNKSLIATRPRIEILVSRRKHRYITISNSNRKPLFSAGISEISRNLSCLPFSLPVDNSNEIFQPIGSAITSLKSVADLIRTSRFQFKLPARFCTRQLCAVISVPRAMLPGGIS